MSLYPNTCLTLIISDKSREGRHHINTVMPPRAFASPEKRRPMKCKGSDATSTKNIVKKSRAQETSVEASSMPLISLGLVHADMSKAGTGGRAAQLEKIGALLMAPSRTNQRKGSTSLSPNILINLQAPELTRSRKNQKNCSKAAPPPYTNVPDTSEPRSIVELLQPPGFSLRQQGARFGFTDNSLIVPPEPNLNHLYDAVGRNIPKNFAKNTGIGHTAAHSVAPLTTGFLEWNLDPVLRDANIGAAEFQSTGVYSSTDKEDGEDDEDNEDNENDEDDGDDPDDGDEQNVGQEGEMREQEISWGEDFPGKSPLCIPASLQVVVLRLILTLHSPAMRTTWQPKRALVGWLRQPGMESRDPLDIQQYNTSQGLPDSMRERQQLQDAENQKIEAAAALLVNSLFLRHGVDNMFNCILDSLRKNGNGKYYPKFTAKEYGPIYCKMLQLLKDILKDHYHGPILLAQLREWAQVGWAESSKINGAVERSLSQFPWYKELDTIWYSNPSFAAKTTLSKPGVDHDAGDMYRLVSPAAPIPSPAPAAPIPSPAPPAPPNVNLDTTMGNVPDLDDDNLYSAAFCAPLGNALDHLDDDDMDTDAPHPTYDLNSPPKLIDTFVDNSQHFVIGFSCVSDPPTSISVQPKTTGSKKKKAKSNIQEQVERVNGEIGSIQSDVASRHNLKHEHFLVKLNVKKDYHCEMKKYEYLCEARTHEAMQAATSHQ
ncbi:hypothetical protein EV424DRAFT_1349428 [Suillus variegatus]|nr:hypothetical protein EV424DRAFT_1349428 [Suillus variegatus]